jgi:hypothetical protein
VVGQGELVRVLHSDQNAHPAWRRAASVVEGKDLR